MPFSKQVIVVAAAGAIFFVATNTAFYIKHACTDVC